MASECRAVASSVRPRWRRATAVSVRLAASKTGWRVARLSATARSARPRAVSASPRPSAARPSTSRHMRSFCRSSPRAVSITCETTSRASPYLPDCTRAWPRQARTRTPAAASPGGSSTATWRRSSTAPSASSAYSRISASCSRVMASPTTSPSAVISTRAASSSGTASSSRPSRISEAPSRYRCEASMRRSPSRSAAAMLTSSPRRSCAMPPRRAWEINASCPSPTAGASMRS